MGKRRKAVTTVTRRAGTIHIKFSERDGQLLARQIRRGYGFFGDLAIQACICAAIAEADRPCAWCEVHPAPTPALDQMAVHSAILTKPGSGTCCDCGGPTEIGRYICALCLEARTV